MLKYRVGIFRIYLDIGYGGYAMLDVEQREATRQFIMKWTGKGKEDEDDRSYWLDWIGYN